VDGFLSFFFSFFYSMMDRGADLLLHGDLRVRSHGGDFSFSFPPLFQQEIWRRAFTMLTAGSPARPFPSFSDHRRRSLLRVLLSVYNRDKVSFLLVYLRKRTTVFFKPRTLLQAWLARYPFSLFSPPLPEKTRTEGPPCFLLPF